MFPFVVIAVAFWGTVLGGGAYFARRFARAAEHRTGNGHEIAQLTSRIAALEDALDGARQDIDRLETGLEFTTRLLASRAEAGSGGPLLAELPAPLFRGQAVGDASGANRKGDARDTRR